MLIQLVLLFWDAYPFPDSDSLLLATFDLICICMYRPHCSCLNAKGIWFSGVFFVFWFMFPPDGVPKFVCFRDEGNFRGKKLKYEINSGC